VHGSGPSDSFTARCISSQGSFIYDVSTNQLTTTMASEPRNKIVMPDVPELDFVGAMIEIWFGRVARANCFDCTFFLLLLPR
jgi:hypothetical protein